MEPSTELAITSNITIKEELACDPESNPQMDMNVKVKQELEDESFNKIDCGVSSIPEAIVKEELIINDTLEPVEWEQKVPVKKKSESKTNRKNFRCKVCLKRFTTKEYANKHSRDVHNVDQGPVSCGRKCPCCDFSSLKNKEFFRHLAKHEDKESGMWRCILCSKLYEDRAELKKHSRGKVCQKAIERKEKQLKSSNRRRAVLDSSLHKKYIVEKPKNSSTSVTPMETPSVIPTCAECNQKFSNRSMYDEHIKYEHEPNGIADRTKRYSCNLCGLLLTRKFSHKKHMEFHEKRHSYILTTAKPEFMPQDENGLIQCSECTEKFPSRESYIAHYKRHMFLKQINAKCVVCGEYFYSKFFLAKHLRTTHKIDPKNAKVRPIEEENGSFSCSACKSTFNNRPSCNVHIRNQHASNFRCETCGTFWQCEASLRRHEKKHETMLANGIVIETNENGLFMCYECPSVFALRNSCLSHIVHYHKKKQTSSQDAVEESESLTVKTKGGFPCTECGKDLSSKHSLTQHMFRHEWQRKCANNDFKCSECGEQVSSEKFFILHASLHIRKKKKSIFTCLNCKKTFSSHESFLKHSLTMHQRSDVVLQTPEGSDNKQIKCTECDKNFKSLQRFRLHFQKMHYKAF